MNPTATAYEAAARPLSTVLDAVPPAEWESASPCTGWTARQVVGHVVETQRALLTGHGHDLGPEPDLTDPAAAFREHAARVLALVSRDEVADTAYDGFFGPTTVGATLVQVYVWDLVVHRWDVARATGGDETLTPEELDRAEAGADAFGDALHMDGICAPAVQPPDDADRQTRLLARLGRAA
ncbi:TIGR03086 family protein [Modestobacter sp. I12A-02628]|uniref:TIGR03086 family protein n=1 Tax=Goekera deserti TaxID=2497753 RepID=A0A7K3WIY3_9ACTN|nr:TIGR03086 family metal-binding protein [Goekera deserti]MPQ97122.1 TIGR03086 family protein [Goekera deserti]NDI46560.1 TIGR03086 family protein [Goekera deserti]NEL56316.1 TIGR03086 family protein [Goekera deserti]